MRTTSHDKASGTTSKARNPGFVFIPAGLLRGLACLSLCIGTATAQANTIYDPGTLSFSTIDQSMWGTGAATKFADSRFVGTQWTNRTAGLGGFVGDVTTVTINANPLWWAWKACESNSITSWACGGEPSKGTIQQVTDTRTGARIDLTTSGKFGLEFGYTVDSGSVNASADFSAQAILPTDALESGEYFNLNPSTALNAGSISSQSPKVEAHINAIAQLSGSVTASACLILHGCSGSGTANLPSVNINQAILSVDPNSLQVMPGLLPGPTPNDPRLPLAKVDLLNQELTLKGALSPEGVPGFQLSTSQFTLVNTIPPGPAVSVDLASIEFKIPDIATSGGLQGDTINSSGRDDVIQARLDLDGVAAMGGFPPAGYGLELIDSGGFKVEAQLDALDIDAGPDIGITQDFELQPTLMARLNFSNAVFIDGFIGPQTFWQGEWNMLPNIAWLQTTTVSPTFWLDAMLTNTLGIDLGLTGTMDILKFDFTASVGGIDFIDTSPISLNSLLGLGNNLFSTDKLQFPVYSTPFMLGGFNPIETAAFTIQVASSVPLPGTLPLLAIGLAAAFGVRRRQCLPIPSQSH